MVLTDDQKRDFIRDGYVVLRNIVPPEVVAEALQVADDAFQRGLYEMDEKEGVPRFHDEPKKHPAIATLMRRCQLLEACNDLLGAGNAQDRKKAQIAFRVTDQHAIAKGFSLHDHLPSHKYHIDGGDGKFKNCATAFSTLVGVCLSPGQDVDESRGQFNVWPGSHFKLHDVVNERVRQGLVNGGNVFGGKPHLKPKIGKPIRVLLRPGDAVIAHQRLGHSGGMNVHKDTRKNLYFRVSHKDHDHYVGKILNGSVFTEYEGLHSML